MSELKKLRDIITWVEHGEQYVGGLNGNLRPHVESAYQYIRQACREEMVDLPALDSLVKSMKRMQQQGSNPYNGYEQSVLIDRYRELKQALWVQHCDYLLALKSLELTLSFNLEELYMSDNANDRVMTGMLSDLNSVRARICEVEGRDSKLFFKQRMIKETVQLNKIYKGKP